VIEQIRLKLQDVRVIPGLFAGAMSGTLVVIFSISLAALIFAGDLQGHLPAGIGIALTSAAIIGIISTLGSSFRPVIAAPQENTAVILALMATSISGYIKGKDPTADPLPTIVAAIALTAVVTGAFFLALGLLRLGKIVRFIPYPVVGGFLAGTGWLLVTGSFSVMTDVPLGLGLLNTAALHLWLPGFLFGCVLTLILRRYHHFLLLPALLAGSILIFYVILLASGTPVSKAGEMGLLLGKIPSGGLWPPMSLSAVAAVNWSVIVREAGNVAATMILAAISILLNASGLELATEKEIDLDRELRTTGVANLATGLLGGMVGYLSLSESTLNHRAGANSRISGVMSAVFCIGALVVGAQAVSYFPKPVLGGLLLFLGLAFLVESVYDAWFRLPRVEYALVILILFVVATVGFLEGVATGIVVSSILFAVNYSRINVIKHAISGVDLRSNVDRRAIDERILEEGWAHPHPSAPGLHLLRHGLQPAEGGGAADAHADAAPGPLHRARFPARGRARLVGRGELRAHEEARGGAARDAGADGAAPEHPQAARAGRLHRRGEPAEQSLPGVLGSRPRPRVGGGAAPHHEHDGEAEADEPGPRARGDVRRSRRDPEAYELPRAGGGARRLQAVLAGPELG
jgi:SulP family sulfate permease